MKLSVLYELRSMLWIILSVLFLILHRITELTVLDGILYVWCMIEAIYWGYQSYKQTVRELKQHD